MAVAATTPPGVADAFDALQGAARRARARVGLLPGELTLPQALLVEPLLGGGSCGVTDLALSAGVSAPTATRMLDGLERDGVVTRERSEHDRRCVHVALTPAGVERAEAARAARAAWREQLFAGLTERERRDAAQLFTRLTDLIEDLRP